MATWSALSPPLDIDICWSAYFSVFLLLSTSRAKVGIVLSRPQHELYTNLSEEPIKYCRVTLL